MQKKESSWLTDDHQLIDFIHYCLLWNNFLLYSQIIYLKELAIKQSDFKSNSPLICFGNQISDYQLTAY